MMENDKDLKNHRKAVEKFRIPTIKLSNDIYSMAFASFIDPEQLEVPSGEYLPKVEMNEDEVANVFLGAVMIIGC